MNNLIKNVYDSMTRIGYETGDFDAWKNRIQLFFATKTGGVAFVSDPYIPEYWWLNVYSPNGRPADNTIRFLMDLSFAAGCKEIRSYVRRDGAAKMLRRVGFRGIGINLYAIKTC